MIERHDGFPEPNQVQSLYWKGLLQYNTPFRASKQYIAPVIFVFIFCYFTYWLRSPILCIFYNHMIGQMQHTRGSVLYQTHSNMSWHSSVSLNLRQPNTTQPSYKYQQQHIVLDTRIAEEESENKLIH